MIFALTAYATGTELGSPSVVYDRLVSAAASHPVDVSILSLPWISIRDPHYHSSGSFEADHAEPFGSIGVDIYQNLMALTLHRAMLAVPI